jgi:DNA-binding TFAR19-related protein (PDSD5 family)
MHLALWSRDRACDWSRTWGPTDEIVDMQTLKRLARNRAQEQASSQRDRAASEHQGTKDHMRKAILGNGTTLQTRERTRRFSVLGNIKMHRTAGSG